MRERAWRAGRACGRRSRRPSGRSPRSRARESAGRRPSVSPLRTHSDVSHRAGSLVKNSVSVLTSPLHLEAGFVGRDSRWPVFLSPLCREAFRCPWFRKRSAADPRSGSSHAMCRVPASRLPSGAQQVRASRCGALWVYGTESSLSSLGVWIVFHQLRDVFPRYSMCRLLFLLFL